MCSRMPRAIKRTHRYADSFRALNKKPLMQFIRGFFWRKELFGGKHGKNGKICDNSTRKQGRRAGEMGLDLRSARDKAAIY